MLFGTKLSELTSYISGCKRVEIGKAAFCFYRGFSYTSHRNPPPQSQQEIQGAPSGAPLHR